MDADPDPAPDIEKYGYRVKTAYRTIMDDIGGLLNNRERTLVIRVLDEMDDQAEADLY